MNDTSTTTKPILRLDASALKIASCARRLYWTTLQGWRSRVLSNDIMFGIAFHKFAAMIEEGNNGDADFAKALLASKEYYETAPMFVKQKKQYLTPVYLMQVCQEWYTGVKKKESFQVVRAEDGTPMVEIPFEIPYAEYDDCIIKICGTIDRVTKVSEGSLIIRDYKTTSSWSKEEYFRSYALSVQLRLYVWAMLHVINSAPETSFLKKFNKPSQIGIAIDGIFHNGADKREFASSQVQYLSNRDMDEFEILLSKEVERLVSIFRSKQTPMREGIMHDTCTTKFGLCPFFAACASPDDFSAECILKKEFIQKPYDPLAFNE